MDASQKISQNFFVTGCVNAKFLDFWQISYRSSGMIYTRPDHSLALFFGLPLAGSRQL